MRTGRIQDYFIPIEPFLDAAIRFRLGRSSASAVPQFRGHHMLRVPELTHSAVCNSSKRAATRWSPVRSENRLPHDKHSQLSAGAPRQQLRNCGGPPQTSRSSRRQKQDQSRYVGLRIECLLELPEISCRKCDNRFLAAWRRAGTPQVRSNHQ